jgi:hypothetical protein
MNAKVFNKQLEISITALSSGMAGFAPNVDIKIKIDPFLLVF